MGIADLRGTFAKLGRAKEHLDLWECEIERFGSTEAKTVRVTFGHENSWHVGYVDPIPAVPLRIVLIIGDYLTNLRATLDHLVWQLVLREGHKSTKINAFPVYKNGRLFMKEVKNTVPGGRPSPLRGLPIDGDAWTLIEQAQPFKSTEPQDHPLAIVEELVNADKHRTLLLQQSWPSQETLAENFNWGSEFEPIKKRFTVAPLSSEHPTEIVRFRFPRGTTPRVHVKGKLGINPSVSDGESPAVPLTQLGYIFLEVKKLLEKFAALPRVER